jgi:catechol 2,3-dioxygenase-like lactoylglutathione lyase family enzyme
VKLTHVRLLVDDYGASFRFYRDVLGLQATFGDESSGYADFRAGDGSALALFDRSEQGEVVPVREAGDGALLVFGVDDVDAEAQRLAEFVVAAPADRADWGIRVTYVRDPAGTLIELNQAVER